MIIRGFFDHVNHDWLIQFIEHRIQDPNIIRLIKRMLKAGTIENLIWYESAEGTVQGGSASPILANIYLHYVVDIWFENFIRKYSKGEAYMVRYADDQVFCFQYKEEAEEFYKVLGERLKKFGLEISEEKSKIIAFGSNAGKEDKNDKAKDGRGKPETFDFLGFTHYCSKSKYGNFVTKRKTSAKKYKASLLRVKQWIQENRHHPKSLIMETLERKLRGYYQYYGVMENRYKLKEFYEEVKKHLFKNLNRRSQKRSYT